MTEDRQNGLGLKPDPVLRPVVERPVESTGVEVNPDQGSPSTPIMPPTRRKVNPPANAREAAEGGALGGRGPEPGGAEEGVLAPLEECEDDAAAMVDVDEEPEERLLLALGSLREQLVGELPDKLDGAVAHSREVV
jgi:hypothetical protein